MALQAHNGSFMAQLGGEGVCNSYYGVRMDSRDCDKAMLKLAEGSGSIDYTTRGGSGANHLPFYAQSGQRPR